MQRDVTSIAISAKQFATETIIWRSANQATFHISPHVPKGINQSLEKDNVPLSSNSIVFFNLSHSYNPYFIQCFGGDYCILGVFHDTRKCECQDQDYNATVYLLASLSRVPSMHLHQSLKIKGKRQVSAPKKNLDSYSRYLAPAVWAHLTCRKH